MFSKKNYNFIIKKIKGATSYEVHIQSESSNDREEATVQTKYRVGGLTPGEKCTVHIHAKSRDILSDASVGVSHRTSGYYFMSFELTVEI